MTRASHHHPDCQAIRLGNTDDDCNCSWWDHPELPVEQRYLLPAGEFDVAFKANYLVVATPTELATVYPRLAEGHHDE